MDDLWLVLVTFCNPKPLCLLFIIDVFIFFFYFKTGLSFTVSDNPQKLSKSDVMETILRYLETDTLLFREDVR